MKTSLLISGLLIYAIAANLVLPAISQTAETNAAHLWKGRYRLGVAPNAAYQNEMQRIMVKEADRFARQMNLPEDFPITKTNITRSYIRSPSWYLRMSEMGTIETTNYSYNIDGGKGVAGVIRLPVMREWDQLQAKYTWPISRFDTNAAFHEALDILRSADIDVVGLNRDASSISITAPISPDGKEFFPVYSVVWKNSAKDNMLAECPLIDLPSLSSWNRQRPSTICKYIARSTF